MVTVGCGGDGDRAATRRAEVPTTTAATGEAPAAPPVAGSDVTGRPSRAEVPRIQPPAPGAYRLEVVSAGDGEPRREDQQLDVALVAGDPKARAVTSTIGKQVSSRLARWTDSTVVTDAIELVAGDAGSRCDWRPDRLDVDVTGKRRSWTSTATCTYAVSGSTLNRTVEEHASVVDQRTAKVAGRSVFVHVIERTTVVRIEGTRSIEEKAEEVELFAPELGIAVRSGIDLTVTSPDQPEQRRRITVELVTVPAE